jgi:hypothetical protein
MKTVNIIATHFYPEKSAGANRITSVVQKLSQCRQVNVIFLTEKGKIADMNVYKGIFNDNVRLYPVEQNDFPGNKFVSRLINETIYSLKLNVKNLLIKSDNSIFSIPYLQLLPVSALFCLFTKRKTIVEIRDVIWLYLDFSGSNLLNKVKKILELLCILSLKQFSAIVTVTDSQLKYIGLEGTVIENGIERAKYEELASLQTRRSGESFTVTYAGTIGYPQNLMTFAETALLLKNDTRFRFVLAGKGNMLSHVLEFVNDNGLTNFEYVGELDWRGMVELYSRSDVLYAQLRDTPSFRTAQPSKIFEYASTGLPIIFGGLGESEEIMRKLRGCFSVMPERPEQVVNALERIYSIGRQISSENIEYIGANYVREIILDKYDKII